MIPPTSQNTNPNGNVIFHTPQDTDPNTAVIPHTSPNSESAPEESQQHDLCGPSPPEKLLSNSASDCHLDDGAYAPPDTMQNDEANKAASEVCDDGAGERSGVGERIDAGGACAGDSHPGQSATFRVLEVICYIYVRYRLVFGDSISLQYSSIFVLDCIEIQKERKRRGEEKTDRQAGRERKRERGIGGGGGGGYIY